MAKSHKEKGTDKERLSKQLALTISWRCSHRSLVRSQGTDNSYKVIRLFCCMWYMLIHIPHALQMEILRNAIC